MIIKQKFLALLSHLYFDRYLKQYSIILSLIILISFLFPRGKVLKYAYQINDIASDAIIAPFTFPILKSEEKLKLDLNEKKKSIPFIFILFLRQYNLELLDYNTENKDLDSFHGLGFFLL